MYLILTASKDTYITNKIIDNKFRATDANVGRAGTIDLFKLYDESTISGSSKPIEISRALIKFDYSGLQSLTASTLDLNANSFQAKIKLFDILGGQATPSNFKLVCYPLSRSFDEGIGRDVSAFGDLDTCNFITSSYANSTNSTWYVTGANQGGLLNSSDIDYISSGNLGSGVSDFGKVQTFIKGNEDLFLDVTTFVSAAITSQLPDHGFRISFSGSEETDNKTRFVKRFASRHSSNLLKVPQLHVSWDDSITDHTNDFIFDVSGSLFLNNFQRGGRANILSGASATAISGDDCVILKLKYNNYERFFTGSQHTAGTDSTGIKGLYSASFAISLSDSKTINRKGETVSDLVNLSGSAKFDAYWLSTDEKVGYHTGSLVIKTPLRSAYENQPTDLIFRFTNLASSYKKDDEITIKVFAADLEADEKVYKTSVSKKSIALTNIFYRVRDVQSNNIVIPFKEDNYATILSSDSSGLYFNFDMDALPAGKSYAFDLLVKDFGMHKVFENASNKFRVD